MDMCNNVKYLYVINNKIRCPLQFTNINYNNINNSKVLELLYTDLNKDYCLGIVRSSEKKQTFFINTPVNELHYLKFKKEVKLHYRCSLELRNEGKISILYLNF